MTSATWGYSEYARHAYAPSDAAAWQVLVDVLGVDESRARYIIVFGGFYLMPPGDVKARRVSDPTHAMTKGQYMRIHPMPRQYPVCATTDWEASVLQENDWCMLVNKPAAVPSHPTVDNLHHNVVACLKPLRPGTQISAAHRLDVATSGLIVMCKRPSFMTAFSALHAAGAISKRYTALLRDRGSNNRGDQSLPPPATTAEPAEPAAAAAAVEPTEAAGAPAAVAVVPATAVPDAGHAHIPLGVLTHYMMRSSCAPKIYRAAPGDPSWQICQLRVLRAEPATVSAAALRRTDGGEEGAAARAALAEVVARGERVVEVEVELMTGRTHQIRAQFSADGYPLVGDALYESPAMLNAQGLPPSAFAKSEMLALQSSRLRFAMPEAMGGGVVAARLDKAWWSDYIVKDNDEIVNDKDEIVIKDNEVVRDKKVVDVGEVAKAACAVDAAAAAEAPLPIAAVPHQ